MTRAASYTTLTDVAVLDGERAITSTASSAPKPLDVASDHVKTWRGSIGAV
jgi:hypothetical protein